MQSVEQALTHWNRSDAVRPADDGLINQTWLVSTPPNAVLQWVNPIFSPLVNEDIDVVTGHLAQKGLPTPRLIRTIHGSLSHPDPQQGHWRLMDFVPGRTLHKSPSPAITHAAGAMLGRFHAAVYDLNYTFQAPSRDIHNTPLRIKALQQALQQHRHHALFAAVEPLAMAILTDWEQWLQRWGDPTALPTRICHGDPKLSNLRFDADSDNALCMLDLDTVGHGTLSAELGDAWRSWCNPGGEDDPTTSRFSMEAFAASARGYCSQAPSLQPIERESLVAGTERICLELASRFCADALENNYFREDRARWPEPGRHNLSRAEGQHRLAVSARTQQSDCDAIMRTL